MFSRACGNPVSITLRSTDNLNLVSNTYYDLRVGISLFSCSMWLWQMVAQQIC